VANRGPFGCGSASLYLRAPWFIYLRTTPIFPCNHPLLCASLFTSTRGPGNGLGNVFMN